MLADMTRLLRKFLAKFVAVRVITGAARLVDVDFSNRDSQLPDDILAVGMEARCYMDAAEVSW